MDKNEWFEKSALLCQQFLQNEDDLLPIIVIRFGCSNSSKYIGRESFQSIYDLVASWSCWDMETTKWDTKITFEVIQEQISNSIFPHAVKYYIESDEHNTQNNCITVVHKQTPIVVELKHTPSIHDVNHVNINCYSCCNKPFKLKTNASFSGVEVVKQVVLEVRTHFIWRYVFSLVWALPYIDDKENINFSLIFNSEPMCKFEITCQKIDPSEYTLWQYLSESILMKIHETIPNTYRSSEGVSVSLPS